MNFIKYFLSLIFLPILVFSVTSERTLSSNLTDSATPYYSNTSSTVAHWDFEDTNYETVIITDPFYEVDVVELANSTIVICGLTYSGNMLKAYDSKDGGTTFIHLSTIATLGGGSSILESSGGDLIIAYDDGDAARDGWIKKSTSSGLTWGSAMRIDDGTNSEPALYELANGTFVYTAYDPITDDWFVRTSTSADTWSDRYVVESNTNSIEGKCIVEMDSGDTLLLCAEEEFAEGGRSRIVQWTSTDGAKTFQYDQILWDSAGNSADVEEGQYVKLTETRVWYITTTDEDDVGYGSYARAKVKYKESVDSGATWGSAAIIRNILDVTGVAAKKFADGNLYICYVGREGAAWNKTFAIDRSTGNIIATPILGSGDKSGSANHGAPISATKPEQVSGGKFGKAYDIDNTEYIDVPDSASLSITTSKSIEAWVKLNGYSAGAEYAYIVMKDGGTRDWYFAIKHTTNDLIFYLKATTYNISTVSLSLNQWYHLVAVYDSVGQTIKIYIDGVDKSGTTVGAVPTSVADTANPVRIGNRTGAENFDGVVDEVRILSRVLGVTEIGDDIIGWKPLYWRASTRTLETR